MSVWHYAYFFPKKNVSIAAENSLEILNNKGLKFDDEIILLEEYEDGHVDISDDVIKIDEPINENIYKRLSMGEQLEVTCRNKDLFITCSFVTKSLNPYVSLGWSSGIMSNLAIDIVEAYKSMFKSMATVINACYIIFVEEPPDYFEDHFIEIDGKMHLDVLRPNGSKYDVFELWSRDNDVITTEGLDLELHERLNDGFYIYSAK